MKKFFKIVLTILAVILTVAIAFAIVFIKTKLNKLNYEKISDKEIEINTGIDENLSEYRNIAILGLDTRDDTFDNSRSDCIIIASINNKTKNVNLVSVYRDTYLYIKGDGLDKVNHAYAYGRAPLALTTLNTNLDLNITEYVTINFDTVITVVDAIGGVTISLTNAEATQIPGINTGGTYTLNGEQALAYGRIRNIDTDYARTERMRSVIEKVFNKAKSMSVTELNNLLDELLPSVATNIKQTEILKLASQIINYNITESFGWPYDVQGITLSAWYAVPVTLEYNVKRLHEELFEIENYEVSDTVKEISNNIINVTGYR